MICWAIFVDNAIPAAPDVELLLDYGEETVSLGLRVSLFAETPKAIEQDSSISSEKTLNGFKNSFDRLSLDSNMKKQDVTTTNVMTLLRRTKMMPQIK